MIQYLDLLKAIKEHGEWKYPARENMPCTQSLFGYQMRFNLNDGFPLITTKKISFKNIVTELLWFLKGDTNVKYLVDNGCNIWNQDAYNYYKKIFTRRDALSYDSFCDILKNGTEEDLITEKASYRIGDCGVQYGKLWRDIKGLDGYGHTLLVDQFWNLIKGLHENPLSRRHIITAWNPFTLNNMALNACHSFIQFNCRQDNNGGYYLDCQMYQRSADVFLGVPYNIASYALLTHIIAKLVKMNVGHFIHTFGDVHIYENHQEQVDLQLSRTPEELPTFRWSSNFDYMVNRKYDIDDIFDKLTPSDFWIENYKPHPSIKAKLSTGLK